MARGKPQESKVSRQEKAVSDYPEKEARVRFERAVDIAAATKPVHKPAKSKPKASFLACHVPA